MTEADQAKMGHLVNTIFNAIRDQITPTNGHLTTEEFDVVLGALGLVAASMFAAIEGEHARNKEVLLWASTVAGSAADQLALLRVPEGVTLQ